MDPLERVFHRHTLYQRKLSEHSDLLECRVCCSSIQGPTSMYCCEKCSVYLHASCATEIPSQIEHHPLHPEHSLTLQLHLLRSDAECHACKGICNEHCGFFCSLCNFRLHVGCAMVNFLPDGESGPEQPKFEHFAHECPLASLNVKHEYNIKCRVCELQLSGEVYGCRSCVFFLHKTCAETPQVIRRHPFHSDHPLTLLFRRGRLCDACDRGVFAAYNCEGCNFDLCHNCMNAALSLGRLKEEIEDSRPLTDHFFHQHPLAFYCTETEMPFRCRACDQHVSGEFYGCPDCSFSVHEPCVQSLPREIRHYLGPNPDDPLILHPTPSGKGFCGSCNKFLPMNSPIYSCKASDFDLHVPCALQTLAYLEQGARKRIEIPMIHETFRLFHALGSMGNLCDSCGKHCQGPAYRCDECYIFYHKSCAEALISSLQSPTLKHPLHRHGLSYFQRNLNSNSLCRACGKRCKVDFYCCVPCNVHIHYDCLQTPQTIKSNHHIDELTLHESIVEDDSGEYYCDICERRRDPELWAYYCKECKLIAHVVCAVSPVKLKPDLEELDEEIKGVQREVDALEAKRKKLTANLEELTEELKASTEKLEASTKKLEALKEERDYWLKY